MSGNSLFIPRLRFLLPDAETPKHPVEHLFDINEAEQLLERVGGLPNVVGGQHGIPAAAEVRNRAPECGQRTAQRGPVPLTGQPRLQVGQVYPIGEHPFRRGPAKHPEPFARER